MVIFSICAASTSWSRYLSPRDTLLNDDYCTPMIQRAKKTRDAKRGKVKREKFKPRSKTK